MLSRGDRFVIEFSEYFGSDSGQRISQWLNDRRHRLKTDSLSYRVINHWESIGILSGDRASGKGWRKYSIMDRVYIEIVIALRNLGFPLEKILKLRESLGIPAVREIQFPKLEFLVAQGLVYKQPSFIVVQADGKAEVIDYEDYRFTLEARAWYDHITLGVFPILQKLFPDKDLSPDFKVSFTLSDAEFELLWMIRMENYESITVKAQDGSVTRLDASKPLDVNKRMEEILKEQDYQNIEIKQRQGQVRYIKTTTRKDFHSNG